MTDIRTEATREKLRLLAGGILQAAAFALRASMKAARDDARATTLFNDRSTYTRRSIEASPVVGLMGRVTAGGMARLLENGSPAHEIVATKSKTLRFSVNGATIFRARVHHPGTAPRPFMAMARERGALTAAYAAEFYVNYAIARV